MRALAAEWMFTLLILLIKATALVAGMACLAVLYAEAMGV